MRNRKKTDEEIKKKILYQLRSQVGNFQKVNRKISQTMYGQNLYSKCQSGRDIETLQNLMLATQSVSMG